MKNLSLKEVNKYVNNNIVTFHENRISTLKALDLKKVLKDKNPYLFKAKNITVASDLIKDFLDARLSSSEEKFFGNFLEDLAIFIAGKTCNGRKSSAQGVDLEFTNNKINYLVSVKSGPNWGNNAQQVQQEKDLRKATQVLKQSKHTHNVEPILGICYGKTRTSFVRGYYKYVGQSFWYLISENKNLYTDIIEPLGYKAKEHNDAYNNQRGIVINLFTEQFSKDFCDNGIINWKKLVQFNSGNLDLE